MILKGGYHKSIFLLTILLILISSQCLALSNNGQADYILIINSYTESTPWSRIFTTPIYERMVAGNEDIDAYTEHMDVMLMKNEKDVEDFTLYLLDKYKKAPKLIILLGNSSYALLKDRLNEKWGGELSYLVCVEKDYLAPREYYLSKKACPEPERQNLSDIVETERELTIIYVPEYIMETVSLMKQANPDMRRLLFLSDKRYISAQNQNSIHKAITNNFPDVKLELVTAGDIQTDELIDILQNADKQTGILYYSWILLHTQGNKEVLSSDTYRMISSYTDLPVFTLNDMDIVENGMAGGFFFPASNISNTLINTINGLLRNEVFNTIITPYQPHPVLNYPVLVNRGMFSSGYPADTIFYMRPPTFWEQYGDYVNAGIGVLLFIAFVVFMRIRSLNRIRLYQEKEIMFMRNYSRLVNSMPICYMKQRILFDEKEYPTDYVILELNPALEALLKCDKSYIGKKGSEIHPLQMSRYLKVCHLIFSENKKINTQYYYKPTDCYFNVLIISANTPGCVDIFMVDVSELAKTQQVLRTVNQKLSMSLDVANVTPWKWDLVQHTILCDVNKAVNVNFSGLFDENQLTVPDTEYFSKIYKEDREKVRKAYESLILGKVNKIKEEYRIYNPNKGLHGLEWVEACAAVEKKDENGKPLTLVGSSLIISDRKEVERELLEAKNKAEESNRLKSAFLANMSHEIRTPLNAIVGFSNILAETDVLEEKQEYAEIIENNNALLLQLINDILDLSKIEAGTLEFVYSDVDVNTLLSDLERSMSKRVVNENVRLVFERKEKDCYVSIAKNRLMQVIINLLTNAIKFTDQGSISYGYSCLNKKMLRFYVSDTGRGISVEQQEAIFDRFVKLDSFAQGTGLGLSICRMIVDHLGGEMGVESEIGKGSTFWFTFPYKAPEKPVREDVIFEKIKVEKDKLTVLIAEDNAGNFKLFETILKNDYTIVHAWNGKEAVELFKEYEPHIVLMDINMPEMNGYEATKEIRKLSEVIPIIAVTAYAFASDEEQVMNSGFDGYASKPLNASALKKQMVDLPRARVFVI